MARPARIVNDWRLCLAAASALGGASALAQEAAPQTGVPAEQGAAQTAGAEPGAPQEGAEVGPEGEVLDKPTTPGIAVLARWIRSAGCRVFIDFPVDANTRFSPSMRERHSGWRISLPRLAAKGEWIAGSGMISGMPGESAEGTEGAEGEAAAGAPAEGVAAEAAQGDVAAAAQAAPAAPRLTWTQRVGLVKSDPAPAPTGAEAAAAPAPEPTWTQRIGLVKSPASAEAASSSGVASFSKKQKSQEK